MGIIFRTICEEERYTIISYKYDQDISYQYVHNYIKNAEGNWTYFSVSSCSFSIIIWSTPAIEHKRNSGHLHVHVHTLTDIHTVCRQ